MKPLGIDTYRSGGRITLVLKPEVLVESWARSPSESCSPSTPPKEVTWFSVAFSGSLSLPASFSYAALSSPWLSLVPFPPSTCLQHYCQKGLVSLFHSKSDTDENWVKKQNVSHSPVFRAFRYFYIFSTHCILLLFIQLCAPVFIKQALSCVIIGDCFFYYNEITTYGCTSVPPL